MPRASKQRLGSELHRASRPLREPVVDESPAYDLLFSFTELLHPEMGKRWAEWVEHVSGQLLVSDQRRMRRYQIALSYMALIPTLPEPHSIEQFLAGLANLALPDFLRIAVTAGYIDPGAPLGASELVALSENPTAARSFVDRYLRLAGRERAYLLQLLAHPASTLHELHQVLEQYAAGPFTELEPKLSERRQPATARLRELVADKRYAAWLETLIPYAQLESFSPVVLAASGFFDTRVSLYYHEIAQPLFDGTSYSGYEPFILCVGTERILSPTPLYQPGNRGLGTGNRPGAWSSDPLERVAATFGALADPSRLRMVRLLSAEPRYGQELAEALGMSAATVSHHITVLLKTGLAKVERRSHRTYYVLDMEALADSLAEGRDFALARQVGGQ